MNRTVEQLKGIGDVMLRLGDLHKAEIIHAAVKLCTVWHKVADELPDKDGTYLVIGTYGTVHTAHFYKVPQKFSNRYVTHWAKLPPVPEG